ncbi:AraC family transcriptional regulator [Paenibacillus selenitireducens]|uniref:AraC family transcriptional regulator n=1 Tax=Paenibacillus selenitireducens TaxID=1324314 RepID=A0A1T2X290_9BACL|nr:AraC family transcriptional regulator [Paenibacillus selenitireducens]OPA73982.1 AraC family transcriptional regulator [Paenibacillus selenitireducens]
MKRLPLRSNLQNSITSDIPFAVYTVGTDLQLPITRLNGFSAKQLFFTFSGRGRFRKLGQDKWDILEPNSLLYIPEGFPHEYMPLRGEAWHAGYVTFVEQRSGMMTDWGFGPSPMQAYISNPDEVLPMIEQIWLQSGPDYDPWSTTETLFSLCLMIKKQIQPDEGAPIPLFHRRERYRETAVDLAIRFLHDHLNRHISIADLAAHIGYSQKQLTRLFREELGQTPLQYLQHIRMHSALTLLHENADMTIRQAAAYVGMEPTYFTRLHRRMYGFVPSKREKHK